MSKDRLSLVSFVLLISMFSPALRTAAQGVQETQPLGRAVYHGQKATLNHDGLLITLAKEVSNDPKLCQADASSSPPSCKILVVKGMYDGQPAFTMLASGEAEDTEGGNWAPAIALRHLDSITTTPQIVLSFSSGGAHCCTSYQIATADSSGNWHVVDAGHRDGDGYGFLDLNHDGSSELVGHDDTFLYAFSSYADSFSPSLILKLEGLKLKDVTRDQRYHRFLLHELHQMEGLAVKYHNLNSNGYLAAWVSQKALLGQLDDAWHTMLASYDHSLDVMSSGGAAMECRVSERVWEDAATPYRHCPLGQEYVIPFPEALTIFLTKNGYITPDQSRTLGYDVAQIEADRQTKMAAATAEYEQRKVNAWYGLTNYGTCILTKTPSSPAELVSFDRMNGLIDSVNVLKNDANGKPLVVRIGEPEGNGMENVYMFFRGQAECEAYRQHQQQQIENLK